MPRQILQSLIVTMVTLSGAMPTACAEHPYRWQQAQAKSLALAGPHGVVWQFNFAPDQTKPYFDPVRLASGGQSLTWNAPPDHAWHHGLWFSWHTINDVNYWEHVAETGRPAGRTTWMPPVISTHEDGSAKIVMQLEYAPMDGKPVLTEVRIIDISAPDATGRYQFDWDSTFHAVHRQVMLACTPIPPHPDGKPWGGYAGLSLRLAAELVERRAATDGSEAEFDATGIHRSTGLACSYDGTVNGALAGIAILSHANNVRNPTPWYAIRSSMSYLNPSFLQSSPYEIGADRPLHLQYRVIIHPGHWSANRLAEEVSDYVVVAP